MWRFLLHAETDFDFGAPTSQQEPTDIRNHCSSRVCPLRPLTISCLTAAGFRRIVNARQLTLWYVSALRVVTADADLPPSPSLHSVTWQPTFVPRFFDDRSITSHTAPPHRLGLHKHHQVPSFVPPAANTQLFTLI